MLFIYPQNRKHVHILSGCGIILFHFTSICWAPSSKNTTLFLVQVNFLTLCLCIYSIFSLMIIYLSLQKIRGFFKLNKRNPFFNLIMQYSSYFYCNLKMEKLCSLGRNELKELTCDLFIFQLLGRLFLGMRWKQMTYYNIVNMVTRGLGKYINHIC